jgi:hypothetical protein
MLRKVQVRPSALVMIRLPLVLPLLLTATNSVLPARLLHCVPVIFGPVFAFA